MTLIKCKECKKETSKKALRCPHCGGITEYGKKILKWSIVILSIVIVIIIFDNSGIFKSCDDGDERKGNICIKKHYFDAQSEDSCSDGLYVKDGRCYQKATGIKLGIPTRKYFCSSGYLDEIPSRKRCVVETTYNVYYRISMETE